MERNFYQFSIISLIEKGLLGPGVKENKIPKTVYGAVAFGIPGLIIGGLFDFAKTKRENNAQIACEDKTRLSPSQAKLIDSEVISSEVIKEICNTLGDTILSQIAEIIPCDSTIQETRTSVLKENDIVIENVKGYINVTRVGNIESAHKHYSELTNETMVVRVREDQLPEGLCTDSVFTVLKCVLANYPREEKDMLLFLRNIYIPRITTDEIKQPSLPRRIDEDYPFPLAYAYKWLSNTENIQDKTKQQARHGENILAFLAAVTLAIIRPEDREVITRDRYGSKKSLADIWIGGASPGDCQILIVNLLRTLATYKENPLAQALFHWSKRNKGRNMQALAEIVKIKNDIKHDRVVSADDHKKASAVLEVTIDRLMEDLSFFSQYPIRMVESVKKVRGKDKLIIHAHDLIGSHPAWPERPELRYHEFLPENELFIVISDDNWCSLYPFLSVGQCAECKNREVYFIDKIANNKALLKSFERGHTMNDAKVGEAFLEWIKC